MDLTTMKSRLFLEGEIKNFNGPGFNDNKILAGILLDIRDLLVSLNGGDQAKVKSSEVIMPDQTTGSNLAAGVAAASTPSGQTAPTK